MFSVASGWLFCGRVLEVVGLWLYLCLLSAALPGLWAHSQAPAGLRQLSGF